MTLNLKQQQKLVKIKKALEQGELGIISLILELEDKLENEIPQLNEVISRIKGDKGDTYVLSDDDRKEIGKIASDLVDQNKMVRDMLGTIDLESIAKQASKYIKVPVVEKVIEKTKVETPIHYETIKEYHNETIKEVENKDTGEQIIGKINSDDTTKIKKEKVDGLKDIEKTLKDLRERPAQIMEVGGGSSGIQITEDSINKKQAAVKIDFGAGFDVTPTSNGVQVTLDGAEPTNFTLQKVTDNGSTTTNAIEALSFVKTGGLSTEFLKADGSSDSTAYLPTATASSTYVPYSGATADVDLGSNDFMVNTSVGAGTSAFFVDADAKTVGIGSPTQNNRLHVIATPPEELAGFFGIEVTNLWNGSTAEAGIKLGVGQYSGINPSYFIDLSLARVSPYNLTLDLISAGDFIIEGGDVYVDDSLVIGDSLTLDSASIVDSSISLDVHATSNVIDLGDGLLKQFAMNDDAANTVVEDTGSLATDGALVGGENTADVSSTGVINESLYLDGNDYVNTNYIWDSLIQSGNWSVSMWVRLDDGQKASYQILWGALGAGAADRVYVTVNPTSGIVSVMLQTNGTSANASDTGNPLPNGDTGWKHIVVTMDAGDEMKYYVDGVLHVTKSTTAINWANYNVAIAPFIGAANYNGTASDIMTGYVDDTRIYDKKLELEEIQALYNSGSGTESTGTIGNTASVDFDDNHINTTGSIKLVSDSQKLLLGAGNDASITYDGTDLVINPKEVGTGVLKVGGNIQPATDDTYYIGKNDDDSPLAYKGIILKDQTDGKYYRLELNSGSLSIVDLSD